MARHSVLMAEPRRLGVRAPAPEEIITAEVLDHEEAYGSALFLVSALGIAYLPVPFDARTCLGLGLEVLTGGLGKAAGAGVVGSAVHVGGTIGETLIQGGWSADRMRQSLKRGHAWTASYVAIVQVALVTSFLARRLRLTVERATNQRSVHETELVATADRVAELTELVIRRRAVAEGVFMWQTAIFELEVEAGGFGQSPSVLPLANPWPTLDARIASAGLTRQLVEARVVARFACRRKAYADCPAASRTLAAFLPA